MALQFFTAESIHGAEDTAVRMFHNGKYVGWGLDNHFPQYILRLVQSVGELNAIILQIHNYVCASTPQNKYKDVVDRLVMDFLLFGGFVCKVSKSIDGSEKYLYYVDIANYRTNEDGDVYFCKEGTNFEKVEPTEQTTYHYYKGTNHRSFYPLPIWYSGLKSAEILNNIRMFNLNNIKNNFSSSGIVSIKGSTLSSQQMKELKKRIETTFCGAKNAGRVLVVNDNSNESKIEFTRIQPDNLADLYKSLQESAQDDLYIAFRINKMLLGENIMSGFSNQEFGDAFKLFNNSVVIPIQKQIERFLLQCGINYTFEQTQIPF